MVGTAAAAAASTCRSTSLALPQHTTTTTTTTTTTMRSAAAAAADAAADAAEAICGAPGSYRRLGGGSFPTVVTATDTGIDTKQRLFALVAAEGGGQAAPEGRGGEGRGRPFTEDSGLPAERKGCEKLVGDVQYFTNQHGVQACGRAGMERCIPYVRVEDRQVPQ